ncbi:MAG: hypothetical protein M0023_04435 [Desulfobacteraceae bacterium]|nr:hypothetical protein [Desulfobacteraceae bacterium]
MAKKLEIFKPGTFTAMDGTEYTFSEADVRTTAAVYNPDLHEAQLVVGHPRHNAPSYGGVKSLEFSDVLLADHQRVDPAFAEMVNAGRFPKISASFYSPNSPNNPVPGTFYLRHVGFLGAMAPAVKGLKTASFAAFEEGVIEFGDYEDRVVVRMFRSIKNYLIGTVGQEQADKVIDEYDLTYLTEDAMTPDQKCDPEELSYHENDKGETMLTQAQIAEKEADLTRRENALKVEETTKKHAGNLSFAEGLVKEGKLLAANKAALVGVLDFAAGVIEGDTIEFGEGDGKKSLSPLDTIKTLFGSMPKVIEFSEFDFSEGTEKKLQAAATIDVSKYV